MGDNTYQITGSNNAGSGSPQNDHPSTFKNPTAYNNISTSVPKRNN